MTTPVSRGPVSRGPVSCVQVDQGEFDQMMTNYRLMLARTEKQEQQLRALTKVSQFAAQTESALKIEKKRSKQYESAYISSEAKLGHLIKTLLLKKEDRPADVDILEKLLGLKTDDLYTGYADRDGMTRADSVTQMNRDGSEHIKPQQGDLETDGSAGSANILKQRSAKDLPPAARDPAGPAPVECGFEPEELEALAAESGSLQSMGREKRHLQNIIREFREQEPRAWGAYMEFKRYEDIVQSLRLEVASLRITCMEQQQLLAAKRGSRTDELAAKAVDLEKKVERLRRELTTKLTALQALREENRELKRENQHLRVVRGDGAAGEEVMREYQAVRGRVEDLIRERQGLEEECQKYRRVLESVEPPPGVTEEAYPPTSWSELWDRNQKLERNSEGYRHVLQQHEKTIQLNQAQFQILEENLKRAEDRNQSLETQILEHTKLEKRLRGEKTTLQRQFSSTQENNDRLFRENQGLSRENSELKRLLLLKTGQTPQPLQNYPIGSAVFAAGPLRQQIESDGPTVSQDDRESAPHSSPPQLARHRQTNRQTDTQHTTETHTLECPQCLREFQPTETAKFEEHKKKCVP